MKESGAGLILPQSGHTTTGSKRKDCSQLRKKEREQVVETLKNATGAILLDGVVKQLSEELHMQHYPERAELLGSLLEFCKQNLEKSCKHCLLAQIACTVCSRIFARTRTRIL